MIALFRNKSKAVSATVQLAVIPAGRYKVKSVITGKDLGVFEKADWVRGVEVKFADAEPVEVLEVVAGTRP